MACFQVATTMSTMAISSPTSLIRHSPFLPRFPLARVSPPKSQSRVPSRVSSLRVVSQQTSETSEIGTAGVAAIAAGFIANPVVAWSLYTLKTTGCGLPPGPGGVIGAVEGVSYLVVVATIAWSSYTKVKTGSGLPSGPSGLLGAVEGLSYLSLLAILVVFGDRKSVV